MNALRLLGFIVFAYAVYAIIKGEVYAKSGSGARIVTKAESPDTFWLAVAIYIGLSIALVAIF